MLVNQSLRGEKFHVNILSEIEIELIETGGTAALEQFCKKIPSMFIIEILSKFYNFYWY